MYIEQSADDNNQLNGSIVCDGKVCVAGFSMAECVDYLFKMFWVFSLEYPNGLEMFFKFLKLVENINTLLMLLYLAVKILILYLC